jgi:hypothetical protein
MTTKYQIIQYKSKSSEPAFGKVIKISHPKESDAPDCWIPTVLATVRKILIELPDENEKKLR